MIICCDTGKFLWLHAAIEAIFEITLAVSYPGTSNTVNGDILHFGG
jgi:hypothetical protein